MINNANLKNKNNVPMRPEMWEPKLVDNKDLTSSHILVPRGKIKFLPDR